jgi:hypothetical protein
LTDEEKEEALEISKYILEIKLQNAFDQIERDINTFLPYMSKFKRGVFSAYYAITTFSLKVDISKIGIDPEFGLPRYACVWWSNDLFFGCWQVFIKYCYVFLCFFFHRVTTIFVSTRFICLQLRHF